MTKALKTALSFSLVLPHFVYSDDLDDFRHIYGDEQTVGIATGYARPLAESPSVVTVVTVITADDIKKMGPYRSKKCWKPCQDSMCLRPMDLFRLMSFGGFFRR